MYKCVNCKSENIEVISQSSITFRYKKVIEKNETIDGIRSYFIRKGLCLECGYVIEFMDDKTLKQYTEDKPYLHN